MKPVRVLAIAATSRRIGYVFIVRSKLMEWRTSARPLTSNNAAAGMLHALIDAFHPDIVVTEKILASDRKGERARMAINAMRREAVRICVPITTLRRVRRLPSKYEEAQSLADTYPVITPWVPKKRKCFESEPVNIVLFDALSIAHAFRKRQQGQKPQNTRDKNAG